MKKEDGVWGSPLFCTGCGRGSGRGKAVASANENQGSLDQGPARVAALGLSKAEEPPMVRGVFVRPTVSPTQPKDSVRRLADGFP